MTTLYNAPVYETGINGLPPASQGNLGKGQGQESPVLYSRSTGPLQAVSILPAATRGAAYYPSYFGDYYGRIYIIPPLLSLIDPALGLPNKFTIWNADFSATSIESIAPTNATGLTINLALPFALGDLKVTTASITVDASAPDEELAQFLFTTSVGQGVLWTVSLLRTNLLSVAPEVPLIEVLKWKTDVLVAKDGTEQRIALGQLARVEHNIKYLMTDDDDILAFYQQLVSQAQLAFSYPLWQEQVHLKATAEIGSKTILIDVTQFDLQIGDQLLLSNGDQSILESVKVDLIAADNLTITLLSTLINVWTPDDYVFRVTTGLIQTKPEIQRGSIGYIEASVTLRVTEFRPLFVASAAPQEIVQDTVVTDRVLSSTIYTLDGIPILNGRPILAEDEARESFEWDIEVIDFDTGVFTYDTDSVIAKQTVDRRFLIKNLAQKFYYNWLLNWMQGQLKPVWLPTWQNDVGPNVQNISGSTVTTVDETFFNYYGASGLTSFQGLWFTHPNGWFARRITAIAPDGQGHTIISLDIAVPTDFPAEGPWEVGLMPLARQAVDEVQREWHPFYAVLITSFVTTKTSSEIP